MTQQGFAKHSIVGCLLLLTASCEQRPPEIVSPSPDSKPSPAVKAVAPAPARPGKGPIPLTEATAGLPAEGKLIADIVTDKGTLSCELFETRAPIAVANFVGLARGLQSFRDPVSKQWVKRPAFDGTTFHRIIKGFMIQGGDPGGDGSGEPGYVFPDEVWSGSKHDRAGQLCMANKGKDTNGMQFFVTDGPANWLDGGYTIFGECSPLEVVHKIALTPVPPGGEKPLMKPRIERVTIRKE